MAMLGNFFICSTDTNATNFDSSYKEVIKDLVPEWICTLEYIPWLWAMFGSLLVGLSGVLPLLVIPIDETDVLKQGANASRLKTLLSFAVGGLLGDVFLHSLPEICSNDNHDTRIGGHHFSRSGLLILTGLIVFVTAEKLFSVIEQAAEENTNTDTTENNNTKGSKLQEHKTSMVAGYLNLVANTLDNFTHGLSLGGAFLVSPKIGLLTTFAILVHEIPHEVGDFAILLRSGFTRWHAAVFQILTAGGGLIGAMFAIVSSGAKTSLEARSSWILPFTTGTFLHIALVTVLPDLLKEDNPKESIKQLLALIFGIVLMAFVTNVFE
ncbi:unnamed protein product [Phaedon cochleariae]|uniref:Zinc transporter ZIP13 homolog n=1 Tax=Phaedon cochleariae TaxID=80249 RepID=A0A9P0DKT5_PHACE|nr:unnamed protein product [Phaedon cochleariae]